MFSKNRAILLTLAFVLLAYSGVRCCFAQNPTPNETARIHNENSIQTRLKEIDISLASDPNKMLSKLSQSFDSVAGELLGINQWVKGLLDKARLEAHPTVQRSILRYYSKSAEFHKIFVDYALKNMTTKVEQEFLGGAGHLSKLDPYPYAMYLVHQDCYDRMIQHFHYKSPKEVSELELDLAAKILVDKSLSGKGPKRLLLILDIDIDIVKNDYKDDVTNLIALKHKIESYNPVKKP